MATHNASDFREHFDPSDKLPAHPYAELFDIDAAGLEEMAETIRQNGLLEEIWVYDDGSGPQILDGRRRLKACELANVRPRFRIFNPVARGNPLDFVIAKNLHRRAPVANTESLIEEYLKIHPDHSNFTVAKMCRIAATTVGRYRTKLENRGVIPKSETRVDSRGQIYTVASANDSIPETTETHQEVPGQEQSQEQSQESKPQNTTPPENTLPLEKAPEKTSGNPSEGIPQKTKESVSLPPLPPSVADFFSDNFYDKIIGAITGWLTHVRNNPANYLRLSRNDGWVKACKDLIAITEHHSPDSVCHVCHGTGEGCGDCLTTGWVSKGEMMRNKTLE